MAVTSRLFKAYLRRFLRVSSATNWDGVTLGKGSKEAIHGPCEAQERLTLDAAEQTAHTLRRILAR